MKKLILTIFIINCSSTIALSQSGWNQIVYNNPNIVNLLLKRDNNNFFAFTYSKWCFKSTDAGETWLSYEAFDSAYGLTTGIFIDSNIGWLAGGSSATLTGWLFKTTNGGLNWSKIYTGYDQFLFSAVCFVNHNTGWAGGWGGLNTKLFKTTDGGSNWSYSNVNSSQINTIKFINENTGWLMRSNSNFIELTTNGGANWIAKTIEGLPNGYNVYVNLFPLTYYDVWAIVQSTVAPNTNWLIFKTTNSGDNWSLVHTYDATLNLANFPSSMTGYIIGGTYNILKTTNSGINWSVLNPDSYLSINTILVNNENVLFAAGGRYENENEPCNKILKTTDGGTSWVTKSYNWSNRFLDIHFKDSQIGVVAADRGIIVRTTNGGVNWTTTFSNDSFSINSIGFFNDNTGYAFCNGGKILSTSDYGISWNYVQIPTASNLCVNRFLNSQTGFVTGSLGVVLKTTNAGVTWSINSTPIASNFSCRNLSFIDDNTGWILANRFWSYPPPHGGSYFHTQIIKTTNCGTDWEYVYDVNFGSINYDNLRFFDNNTGWMSTNRYIKKTTNGGVNWADWQTFVSSATIMTICMLNQNTGWIGGQFFSSQYRGFVYRTTDGGNNWVSQFNTPYRFVKSIFAVDTIQAWFCGYQSSIYKTTDGGGVLAISNINSIEPSTFSLHQNYPNPFNPVTKIRFDIPIDVKRQTSNVKLIIYDVVGKEVAILVNEQLKPGTYEAEWDGSNYASGVYFYKLITYGFAESRKMILIK